MFIYCKENYLSMCHLAVEQIEGHRLPHIELGQVALGHGEHSLAQHARREAYARANAGQR